MSVNKMWIGIGKSKKFLKTIFVDFSKPGLRLLKFKQKEEDVFSN